ncbi:MAG: hypothetical protein NTV07_06740 [Candidatus Omnitrophica bacterium]|nr:hypothetical protein [Candidatus Omnitrophota bacterium]
MQSTRSQVLTKKKPYYVVITIITIWSFLFNAITPASANTLRPLARAEIRIPAISAKPGDFIILGEVALRLQKKTGAWVLVGRGGYEYKLHEGANIIGKANPKKAESYENPKGGLDVALLDTTKTVSHVHTAIIVETSSVKVYNLSKTNETMVGRSIAGRPTDKEIDDILARDLAVKFSKELVEIDFKDWSRLSALRAIVNYLTIRKKVLGHKKPNEKDIIEQAKKIIFARPKPVVAIPKGGFVTHALSFLGLTGRVSKTIKQQI